MINSLVFSGVYFIFVFQVNKGAVYSIHTVDSHKCTYKISERHQYNFSGKHEKPYHHNVSWPLVAEQNLTCWLYNPRKTLRYLTDGKGGVWGKIALDCEGRKVMGKLYILYFLIIVGSYCGSLKNSKPPNLGEYKVYVLFYLTDVKLEECRMTEPTIPLNHLSP